MLTRQARMMVGGFPTNVKKAFYQAMQIYAPDYYPLKNCGQFDIRTRISADGKRIIVDIIDNPESLINPRDNIWRIIDRGRRRFDPKKRAYFWTTNPDTGRRVMAFYTKRTQSRSWYILKPRVKKPWSLSSTTEQVKVPIGTSSKKQVPPYVAVQPNPIISQAEGKRFMIDVFKAMCAKLDTQYSSLRKMGWRFEGGRDYWDKVAYKMTYTNERLKI